MKKIVVDCLGGDLGPEVIARGALLFLKERKDVAITFAGPKAIISKIATELASDESRISYLDTSLAVTNHDDPKGIIRGYEGSSLVLSLKQCKEDEETLGMLSAGNTGAILMGSVFRLGLLSGVHFPCLAACLPFLSKPGYVCLLDCGASVNSTPQNLLEFANFGSAFMEAAYGIAKPKVGLLNVGKEEGKGNSLAKDTYPLLKASGLNFVGNIEGNDILSGNVDVAVTDGFAGNIVLKNSEALGLSCAGLASRMMEKSSSVEAKDSLKALNAFLYATFAYNDLGCSILLGSKKIIVKPHGKANERTIENSLKQFMKLSDGNLVEKMEKHLGKKD